MQVKLIKTKGNFPLAFSNVCKLFPRTGHNSISISPIKKKKLGELVALKPEMHPMRGTIYYNKDDESMIIVSGFYYPSPGPDAFFWAGSDSPGCDEHSIDHHSYPMAPGKVGSK